MYIQEGFAREVVVHRGGEQGLPCVQLARGEGSPVQVLPCMHISQSSTSSCSSLAGGHPGGAADSLGCDRRQTRGAGDLHPRRQGVQVAEHKDFLHNLFSRLKLGSQHQLSSIEQEVVGMMKGDRKFIIDTSETKAFEVEVMKVKASEENKAALEAGKVIKEKEIITEIPVVEETDPPKTDDVLGRMAKLGQAAMPGRMPETQLKENMLDTNHVQNEQLVERSNAAVKERKEDVVVHRDIIEERRGSYESSASRGGGGGVTEWSLLMSEVRLQNTELRMSLARVGMILEPFSGVFHFFQIGERVETVLERQGTEGGATAAVGNIKIIEWEICLKLP